MRSHLVQRSPDSEKVIRGGFLRKAGVAGLAIAGIGELVAAPLADARASTGQMR